jgi:hypothetical protein
VADEGAIGELFSHALASSVTRAAPATNLEPHLLDSCSSLTFRPATGVSAKVAARLRGDLIPKTVHCNLPTGEVLAHLLMVIACISRPSPFDARATVSS